MLRTGAWISVAMLLVSACARPVALYPELSSIDVESERIAVQKLIIERYLDHQDRVDRIAWPVLKENIELCRKFTTMSYGLKLGDDRLIRDRLDGLTLKQVREAGYSDRPVIISAPENGPAGKAGLKRGMHIVSIDGAELRQDLDIVQKTFDARLKAYEEFGDLPPMKVIASDGVETIEASLAAERVCAPEIKVVNTNDVNAAAGVSNISIYVGLLDRMPDDNNIAMVIGHELAHVAGRHVRKTVANSTRSGYVFWGLPIQAGAGLVDIFVAGPLEAISGVETGPGNALVTRLNNGVLGIQDFEREADYVGLYMASRAGYDIDDAEETFRILGQISPSSTYGERSHPTTPERTAAIAVTRREIEGKLTKGERIVPFGWPIFNEDQPDVASDEQASE